MTGIQNSSQNEKAASGKKYRNEVSRKILHMLAFLIVVFIYFTDRTAACLVIGIALILLFACNSLLLYSKLKFLNDIKVKYFSFILRDNEKYGYISSNWFLLGCFLSVLLFPKYVAMLGITILIFGDAFAALIGMRFGKHKFKNGKSVEGTLAFIGVSYLFLAGFAVVLKLDAPFILAAIASIPVTAVSEIYSKQIRVDDNLLIPIVFGVLMVAMLFIFETFGVF
ncbi:MAG: SEC59/DGK1/VTE5 family protein [Methanimicrococcus sp.]|nr:SEC59/DGK1/VTE5 family protein [Methanimicrococcus sp.]